VLARKEKGERNIQKGCQQHFTWNIAANHYYNFSKSVLQHMVEVRFNNTSLMPQLNALEVAWGCISEHNEE
jgi:hemoglobin-like flavoprotein